MKSVLQDWVMELPLRFQGTLLTAVRGCESNCTQHLYPWRGFVEPVAALLLAISGVILFVMGGAGDLRWYWRVACWIGCVVCYIAGFRITHDALNCRLWWFGL